MSLIRASFFFAVAFVEFRSVFISALSSSGFKEAGPIIATSRCFQQLGFTSYPFLGQYLDQLNCTLNATFLAGGNGSREGYLQLSVFGALLLSSVTIGVYESFRPVHKRSNPIAGLLARSASLFLLAGQRFTAGFTTPLQLVFTTWSTANGSVPNNPGLLIPAAEDIWSTLCACTLGYLLPTAYMLWYKGMDYQSLSIWQPFPVYILAFNLVLPPLIRKVLLPRLPFSRNQSRLIAIVLIALQCTIVSGAAHWQLLAHSLFVEKGVDIRDVFLLRAQPAAVASTFAHAAHLLFTIDFAAVLVTGMALVLPSLGGGVPGVIRNTISFALMTLSAGPGAALIITWAYAEIARQGQAAQTEFKDK